MKWAVPRASPGRIHIARNCCLLQKERFLVSECYGWPPSEIPYVIDPSIQCPSPALPCDRQSSAGMEIGYRHHTSKVANSQDSQANPLFAGFIIGDEQSNSSAFHWSSARDAEDRRELRRRLNTICEGRFANKRRAHLKKCCSANVGTMGNCSYRVDYPLRTNSQSPFSRSHDLRATQEA
jgi:hypothetical protein